MRNIAFLTPQRPPEELLSEVHVKFESEMQCGGVKYSFWDTVKYSFLPKPQYTSLALNYSDNIIWPENSAQVIGKPTGVATFLKSDVDKANENMRWRTSGRHMHHFLEWWAWTLGATCGVGLAYTDSNPHIRLYTLPPSQMRGAIGWMYGPPLGRNRTMQLSTAITEDTYMLRLLQHEGGHFLGHYGSGSHSNRREDIMYPTLLRIVARPNNWGKSERDIAWEQEQFGEPWIVGE